MPFESSACATSKWNCVGVATDATSTFPRTSRKSEAAAQPNFFAALRATSASASTTYASSTSPIPDHLLTCRLPK
jgi:hypothetical protein